MKYGSCVYRGYVYHKRVRPSIHSLRYRVYSMYLNIDKLDELASRLLLFSRNRWNIFSFRDRDFGEKSALSLREYVEYMLRENAILQIPASIYLLCYPRVLGYAFNPLAVFYCKDEDGKLFAVLHEVHNTFGERHAYTLPVSIEASNEASNERRGQDDEQVFTQHCAKQMHVSPFTPMQMQYQFRLNNPADSLSLVINAHDSDGLMLTASVSGERADITDFLLLKYFVIYPMMTLKVIVGIHWEALRLWIKRVPWFSHQPKSTETLK